MLLVEAVAGFLLALEARGRSPRTLATYRHRLAGFQRFCESRGLLRLGDVTPGVLDAWAVSLRRLGERWGDHPTRTARDGGLSDFTIAGRVQAVRTFFNWCGPRGV